MVLQASKHFEPDMDAKAMIAWKHLTQGTSGQYVCSGAFAVTAPDAFYANKVNFMTNTSGEVALEVYRDVELPSTSTTAGTYDFHTTIQAMHLVADAGKLYTLELTEPIIATSGICLRAGGYLHSGALYDAGIQGWIAPKR